MENSTNFETFGSAVTEVPNVMGRTAYEGASGRTTPMAISPTTTGAEALTAAGIDWKVDVTSLAEAGFPAIGADKVFVSQRSDNGAIIGVNGQRYHTIQNDVLGELGDTVRRVVPEAAFVQGGMKNGGEKTFLILDLGRTLDLGGGDLVTRNLMFGTGHNGTPVFGSAVNGRMWCSNQWTSFSSVRRRLITVRHTATAEERLRFAHRTLELALEEMDEWDEALRRLVNTPVRADEHFKAIVGPRPDDDKRAAVTRWEGNLDRLWAEYAQDFNANLIGTGAGVLMAAQGADEHSSQLRGTTRDEQRVNRLLSASYPMAERAMASLVTV